LIVCRSDFSRELLQFATKVAPTHTCEPLCLRGSYIFIFVQATVLISKNVVE